MHQHLKRFLQTALCNLLAGEQVHNILQTIDQRVADVSFVVGAEGSNAINVAMQFVDENGEEITSRRHVKLLVLADANGDAFSAVDYDTIAVGTDGAILETVADKVIDAITEADGDLDITFTKATGAATSYLAFVKPDGSLKISGAITHAA